MDSQLIIPTPALANPAAPAASVRAIAPEGSRLPSPRLLFIDNLRWVMIILVLSMHAAVTYSNIGSWYYNEPAKLGGLEKLAFVTYQAFLQSFFMGLLFFIAGYFVPGAYDRKGGWRFLRDRAIRLGLPTGLYILALHPLTVKIVYGVWGRIWPGGTGPLWFCAALLIFCAVYALFRGLSGGQSEAKWKRAGAVRPFPRKAAIAGFILLIAAATYLVRIPWPNGTSYYNMQFCYFPQYILFFIAGTLAYRYSWLTTLSRTAGKWWGRLGLFGGLPGWFAILGFGGAFSGQTAAYTGGWTLQSAGLCCWEALAGVGLSIGCLTLFRAHWSAQGARAKFFSANAFAVYVFHPPILCAITLGIAGLHWPPLIKFLIATAAVTAASFTLCALVFRRIPLLKKIL